MGSLETPLVILDSILPKQLCYSHKMAMRIDRAPPQPLCGGSEFTMVTAFTASPFISALVTSRLSQPDPQDYD